MRSPLSSSTSGFGNLGKGINVQWMRGQFRKAAKNEKKLARLQIVANVGDEW
jgi:hypothetical protein